MSYCFRARAGRQALEKGERLAGFGLELAPLREAIGILERDWPANYKGKFIVERDLAFLRKAAQGSPR